MRKLNTLGSLLKCQRA